MDKQIINVSNISKIYNSGGVETVALKDIDLIINKGEFVAIMGPSGSGKSTFMHILGGLDLPTSGEYFLDGKDISKMSDDQLADIRNEKIGFVFQAYNLLPRMSALDNVVVPMEYAGISESDQVKRATELLTMVGLENRINYPPNQLSGGQQQRVAIARALVMDPSIILADEPTGNIATTQAEGVMRIFTELNDEGNTVIMITHEPEIAEYAKRVVYIRDGVITEDKVNKNRRVIKRK